MKAYERRRGSIAALPPAEPQWPQALRRCEACGGHGMLNPGACTRIEWCDECDGTGAFGGDEGPTQVAPGTQARIAIYALRNRRGEEVLQAGDRVNLRARE